LIQSVGIVPQNRKQPFLKIMAPIEVNEGSKRVRIEPSSTPRITYSIHYEHPLIKTQTYAYDCSASSFESEIAEARTFGFLYEVQALWARGLGKGGTLDNTIVLSDDGVVNESGLRFGDEFVRHKILDLIGDFSLLGMPFIGHIVADRSGHALHTRLVQQILTHPEKWMLLNAEPAGEGKRSTAHTLHLQPPSPFRLRSSLQGFDIRRIADLQVGHILHLSTSQHGTPGVSGLTPGASYYIAGITSSSSSLLSLSPRVSPPFSVSC
jgi:UDP-3-O-[3-hydroxymyristoyl] N-acetylglucosamine deacetylase